MLELLKETFGLEVEPAMTKKEWIVGIVSLIGLMGTVALITVLIWAISKGI